MPLKWPQFGDEKIIRYLEEHRRPQIWRNYAVGMYARPGESRAEFVMRCRETLLVEGNRELGQVREIFLRRFLELEQKLIAATENEEQDPHQKNRKCLAAQDLFSKVREELGRWVLCEDYRPLQLTDLAGGLEFDQGFDEKLSDLRQELVSAYNRINSDYVRQADEVELYEVSRSYLQIEVLSRGILWAAGDQSGNESDLASNERRGG